MGAGGLGLTRLPRPVIFVGVGRVSNKRLPLAFGASPESPQMSAQTWSALKEKALVVEKDNLDTYLFKSQYYCNLIFLNKDKVLSVDALKKHVAVWQSLIYNHTDPTWVIHSRYPSSIYQVSSWQHNFRAGIQVDDHLSVALNLRWLPREHVLTIGFGLILENDSINRDLTHYYVRSDDRETVGALNSCPSTCENKVTGERMSFSLALQNEKFANDYNKGRAPLGKLWIQKLSEVSGIDWNTFRAT